MSGSSDLWLLTRRTDPLISTEDASQRIQRLQDVLDDLGDRLKKVVRTVEQIEQITNCKDAEKPATEDSWAMEKQKSKDLRNLPDKQFQPRNSLLSDLFSDNKHMRSVYNIWAAVLFMLFLHTVSHDLVETGTMKCGIITMIAGFDRFPQVLKILLLMTLLSFAAYGFHSLWAHQRLKLQPNSLALKIWDYSWLLTLIAYQSAFLALPAKAAFSAKFPPPSTIVITMEQVRMMMKIHAFVRSTSPAVLAHKPHAEGREFTYPGFSKFLYFFFAPTLVYRDSYPRTKTIRWSFVASHLLEVIFVIFFVAFIYERFILPTYSDHGLEPFTVRSFVSKFFNSVLPAMGMYLCGFYCLLHAWFNAWAELLRFGDRMFYKDWWTATSFDAYYRKWNVVVHDWLYTYLYKDVYELVLPGNRFFATGTVFAVSAVFHEYILSISFRMLYPVLFLLFGIIGYPLVYLTRKTPPTFANLFFWLLVSFGDGMLLTFYSMEYYARVNCPGYEDLLLHTVMPRSILCNGTAEAM